MTLNYLGRTVDPTTLTPGSVTLDSFDVPVAVNKVTFESDELTCRCPITGQPDFYEIRIEIPSAYKTIESKSLKLFLQSYAQLESGMFAEVLAADIASRVAKTVSQPVFVVLSQKARGGISITTEAIGGRSLGPGSLGELFSFAGRPVGEGDGEEEE